jgi:hypothetical protein
MAILFDKPGSLGWNINLENPWDKALGISDRTYGSIDRILKGFDTQRKTNEARDAANRLNDLQVRMASGENIDFSKVDTTGLDPSILTDMLYKQASLNERARHNRSIERHNTSILSSRQAAKAKAERAARNAMLMAANGKGVDFTALKRSVAQSGDIDMLLAVERAAKAAPLFNKPDSPKPTAAQLAREVSTELTQYEPNNDKIDRLTKQLMQSIPKSTRRYLTDNSSVALKNMRQLAVKTLGVSPALLKAKPWGTLAGKVGSIEDLNELADYIYSTREEQLRNKVGKEHRVFSRAERRELEHLRKELKLMSPKDLTDPTAIAEIAKMFENKK